MRVSTMALGWRAWAPLSLALAFAIAASPSQRAGVMAQTPGSSPGPGPQGIVSGTLPAGWNLVAGPAMITGSSDPLYTLPSGATAYQSIPSGTPLQPGVGYWAYFATPGQITLGPPGTFHVVSINLPSAGYALIGNPYGVVVRVEGADAVYTYDPAGGRFVPTDTLLSSQGAVIYVSAPTTITLSPPPQYIH